MDSKQLKEWADLMGISVEDIHRELQSRHIIDHKVKQEKMTK